MRAKLYKFTVADIALALQVPKHSVYRHIRLGRLDPASLPSIVDYAKVIRVHG